MRTLRSALAVASLTLALMAFPSASASHEICGHDNQAVYEDVRDTLGGDRQCGTLTDPCFQDNSCPRSCGGGTNSPVTWFIGPIYCVALDDSMCDGDNEYLMWDVEHTVEDPKDPQCGSLTDPCFVDDSCYAPCGYDEGIVTWTFGPMYCTASVDAAWAPCAGPNEYVMWDVRDTLSDPTSPECGSLTDPCFVKNQCNGGCGGDGVVTWIIGPIYCTLASEGERQPGQPSNGCGPDAVERIIGPIYCV